MSLTIKTDHKWKNFLYGNEVPKKVLAEYDWLSEDEKWDGWVRRGKEYYHISDFMRIPGPNPFGGKWNGYFSDSFFSGIVIEMSDDGEQYKIGLYTS